jgi:uncharacterized protein (DUF1330 family)
VIRRLQPGAIAALARADIPGPVDVLNLITTDAEHFPAYRWYGLLVAPALQAVGGRPLWMSAHERALLGEPLSDKLMVVRYPSHRRFLAMVLNPYYFAINELRERGVTRFEASFTRVVEQNEELAGQRRLVVVHYRSPDGGDALPAVRAALEGQVGPLVYASRLAGTLTMLAPAHPTDPTPISLPETACFASGDDAPEGLSAQAVTALRAAAPEVSVQLYRRESPAAYLPPAARKLLRRVPALR